MQHRLPPAARRRARLLVAALLGATAPLLLPAQGPGAARGIARFETGDLAGARAEFDALLRANRRDAGALLYLGRIALLEGRTNDAVGLLEQAVAMDGRRADHHVWLGVALGEATQRANRLRQPGLARRVKREFEVAVALDPRNVTARQGLVQLNTLLPGFLGGSVGRAREHAAELARIDVLQGHLATAFIAVRQGDTIVAERAHLAAVQAAPDSATAHLALAEYYAGRARWSDTFAAYDRLLARQPANRAVQLEIGRTAARSGQSLDRGAESLRRWIAAPPADAPRGRRAAAHHLLGRILERQGRRDAARTEYASALRIDPDNADLRKSLDAVR